MKRIISIAILVIWFLSVDAQTVNGVSIQEKQNMVTIQNNQIIVKYDLDKGNYSAFDKKLNIEAIENAYSQVNELNSNDKSLKRSYKVEEFVDKLGKGATLLITATKENHPIQLLKIKVYDNQPFLVLQSGISNTLKIPYSVKNFSPLVDASIFKGLDIKQNFKLLDGEGGAAETAIRTDPFLRSQNNLLLNFGGQSNPHSLIAGGLTYQEFEKFASITDGRDRKIDLAKLANRLPLMEYIDAGNTDFWLKTEYLDIDKSGNIFNISYAGGFAEAKSIVYDKKELVISLKNLNPNKTYTIGLTFGAYDSTISQSISLLSGTTETEILAPIKLPNLPANNDAALYFLLITPEMMKAGMPRLKIKKESGSNAIISELVLFEGTVAADKLGTPIVVKTPSAPNFDDIKLNLFAQDAIGKLVDPGQTYFPEKDAFYLDFLTKNPIEIAEKYAKSVRIAQDFTLNAYYFPTICLWYAMQPHYGGTNRELRAINDSPGAVAEMQNVKNSGWLKYTTMGIRLVPDCYAKINQNGWWDDEHWRLHGSGDEKSQGGTGMELLKGHYREPYETSEKWAKAITNLGGLPFTYFQTGVRSKDYAERFPNHMLYNKSFYVVDKQNDRFNETYGSYDFTDSNFVKHMQSVYKNLNVAGVKGMMFDYPHTAWAYYGGMDDKYATTASHYRNVFQLATSGLGEKSYVQERNLTRGSDVTVGTVLSQRIWGDTDALNAEMVKRGGLRWYKNRVLFNYDMDAKSLSKAFTDNNEDGLNKLLTMSYVTGSRFLIGQSFAQLNPNQVYKLSRVFPFHQTPQSARPIDAFVSDYPRVYDFEVDSTWHQLTFYNEDDSQPKTITASLSGTPGYGGLGLNEHKKYYVYDFWNNNLVGVFAGSDSLKLTIRKGEARMVSVREQMTIPQVLSTDRHLMQGYIELSNVNYANRVLSGNAQMVEGETMKIIIATNGKKPKSTTLEKGQASFKMLDKDLMELSLLGNQPEKLEWKIRFF